MILIGFDHKVGARNYVRPPVCLRDCYTGDRQTNGRTDRQTDRMTITRTVGCTSLTWVTAIARSLKDRHLYIKELLTYLPTYLLC